MIKIVLLEPEIPGNIGACARIMKNFGFKQLEIVNPKVDPFSEDAKRRAKNANDVLSKANVVDCLEDIKADYFIGTSSKLGGDYNLVRTPMTSRELANKISELNISRRKIAIIFGRESRGLDNVELTKMDYLVTIPTSKYSALNLSHAVSVILYELFMAKNENKLKKTFTPISSKEKDVLMNIIDEVLDKQDYRTLDKKMTQKIVWKHIITKSMLTKRESFALMGFFRKFL